MRKLAIFVILLSVICAHAQDPVLPEIPTSPAVTTPAILDDGVRVSVLGYHDFAEDLPETAMRIHPSKFRKQMEAIQQLGIKVISLADFTAWKIGNEKFLKIPS